MRFNVTLTLQEELLGTSPCNPDIYREYIASKRVDGVDSSDEEVAALPTVDEELQKSTTVFGRTPDGKPFLYDYQIKGFFKDACGALKRADDTESSKLKAYKKEIDGLVFVSPRVIVPTLPDGAGIGICQRPLRAQTAQGERISLARSETIPAGSVFTFVVEILSGKLEDAIYEWFDYGRLRGLGQWRNSGKGRFDSKVEAVKVEKVDK
jgi:hypothetical protein